MSKFAFIIIVTAFICQFTCSSCQNEQREEARIAKEAWDKIQSLDPTDPDSIPILIEFLDSKGAVAAQASLLLAGYGADAVEPLLKAIENGTRSSAAILALQRIGLPEPGVVDALIEALYYESFAARVYAAGGLGKIGPPDANKAIPMLIHKLNDKSDDVRRAIIWALGEIGPQAAPEIFPAILKMLNDDSIGVRYIAAETLANWAEEVPAIGQSLMDSLGEQNPPAVRIAAAYGLNGIGKENEAVVETIVDVFENYCADFDIRNYEDIRFILVEEYINKGVQILCDLADENQEVYSILINFTKSEDYQPRVLLSITGGGNSETAIDLLIALLDDDYVVVRYRAAWLLGLLYNNEYLPKALPKLKEVAEQDPYVTNEGEYSVRDVAIMSIERIEQALKKDHDG